MDREKIQLLNDATEALAKRVAAVEASHKGQCERCCECEDKIGALLIRIEELETKVGVLPNPAPVAPVVTPEGP